MQALHPQRLSERETECEGERERVRVTGNKESIVTREKPQRSDIGAWAHISAVATLARRLIHGVGQRLHIILTHSLRTCRPRIYLCEHTICEFPYAHFCCYFIGIVWLNSRDTVALPFTLALSLLLFVPFLECLFS